MSGVLACAKLYAQSGQGADSLSISTSYVSAVADRAGKLEARLDKEGKKVLHKFQKQEERILRKLYRKDSVRARAYEKAMGDQYASLQERLMSRAPLQQYIPSLDTITSSLNFLNQAPSFLKGDAGAKIKDALGKVDGLKSQLSQAEQLKQFLKERKSYIRQQLGDLGFVKELKQINKQAYYYAEQLAGYKEMLKDHKKAERKALELLAKSKPFKDFMRKHSQLAALFRMPGDPNDPTQMTGLTGLQTRAHVNGLIQQQLTAGGPNAQAQFQQNMQEAQSQLSQLKDKVARLGSNRADMDMPEGFKPNNQKTKRFKDRLEVGTNMQSQKSNGWFPTTTDLGLSVGYKLNDKSVIGAGASYKLGLGANIRNINITHQGLGLRSFIDWKLKGSFWVSGGYEMNYRSEINRIEVLNNYSAWQTSGLVGVSKVISLKTKFFKKTKAQLLWDFMSYQQVPKAQPIVFRVGYSF